MTSAWQKPHRATTDKKLRISLQQIDIRSKKRRRAARSGRHCDREKLAKPGGVFECLSCTAQLYFYHLPTFCCLYFFSIQPETRSLRVRVAQLRIIRTFCMLLSRASFVVMCFFFGRKVRLVRFCDAVCHSLLMHCRQ